MFKNPNQIIVPHTGAELAQHPPKRKLFSFYKEWFDLFSAEVEATDEETIKTFTNYFRLEENYARDQYQLWLKQKENK